nr:unnamed protein product [Callosobruchus chinensis]
MIIQSGNSSEMDSLTGDNSGEDETDSNRSVIHRKSSLALTPEDEPLEIFGRIGRLKAGICTERKAANKNPQ